jgi:uncharacterized protein
MGDYQLIRRVTRWFLCWMLFCTGTILLAQSDAGLFPPKPDPAVYVHDYSGVLSANERNALETRLRRYYDSTSTQIVVMIRPDIGDYDKAMYAIELGRKWGVGGREKNNGIMMLIKTEEPDRGIFIATGYGVEGALPDMKAGTIIRRTMVPLFREKRYSAGINAGITEIIQALSGEFRNDGTDQAGSGVGAVAVLVALLILFIFMLIIIRAARRNRATWYTDDGTVRRRYRSDPWAGSGGGGWWIGGGGFGGGSGGGWGGGSSGGGSFGGGDFGGGGAGGDW